MSIKHEPTPEIPAETCRVVHAILPHGNLVTRMRDHLGTLFTDEQFTDLFSSTGQPAFAPWRLALITLLQFLEHVTDRQAAEAVGTRIDWKYALALDLTDGTIDHTVLSEFRTRLVHGTAEDRLFEMLLLRLRDAGYVKAGGHQRTDSTHVLAAIRQTHRLERVIETLRATLNVLAVAAPDWIRAHIPLDWVERYDHRIEMFRLPKSAPQRQALAQEVGVDGQAILRWIDEEPQWLWLKELPMVQTLRRMWATQYTYLDTRVQWRPEEEMPSPCEQIASPYDPEARWATKGSTRWVGYKVHFTETCDPEVPHLITHVDPPQPPNATIKPLPTFMNRKPSALCFLMNTWWIPATSVLRRFFRAGTTTASSCSDPCVRVRAGKQPGRRGLPNRSFALTGNSRRSCVRWDAPAVPGGREKREYGWTLLAAIVSPVRGIPNVPNALTEPLRCARSRSRRPSGRPVPRKRPKSSSTAMLCALGSKEPMRRRFGSRRSRYRSETKTRRQMAATASALNLIRLDAWLQGDAPAQTRHARFARLLAS
ncbi:MAG: transposase [Ktedonobacterales bacterium]|nr:transposase [Ktedonobacterales bacterium]